MSKLWVASSLLALLLAALFSRLMTVAETTRPAPTRPTTTHYTLPQTPGFHDRFATVSLNGQQRKIAYTLYLPKNYDPAKPWPMVVFLMGVGSRGDDHSGDYDDGPLTALSTDESLAAWAPFIVLVPQCPVDQRWEMPGMPKLVMDLIEMAKQNWAVDPDRVYLTGLSMGGRGVWNVALAAPRGAFAAIAPLCSIEVSPDKIPDAVRGSTVLIICGGADNPEFIDGSRKMYQTLKDHQIDATYAEVPGIGHNVWAPYYASRLFYQFLLMNTRGQKSATTRPSAEQLVAVAYTPPNSADADLQQPLQKFLPWWFVSNCGRDNSPGLKDQVLGRKNIFVTTPLGKAVPCRLMITTPIPRQKQTALILTVAAHPQGQWQLIVRADQKDIFKQTIGPGDKPATRPAGENNPWVDLSVDLTACAGDNVHLELLNSSTGSAHSEAYWGKVELVSK